MIEISDNEKDLIRQIAVSLLNKAWLTQYGQTPVDLISVLEIAKNDFQNWMKDSEVITRAHEEIIVAFDKQFRHQIIMNFTQGEDEAGFNYQGAKLVAVNDEFEIDQMFDKIGDGLYGDLYSIEKAIPFASIDIASGETGEKIIFDLERFGKRLACVVTMFGNSYQVFINGRDYGCIEMDDEEGWVQRSGVSMPQNLVDTIGRIIEQYYD
jgi:hypothetical protein